MHDLGHHFDFGKKKSAERDILTCYISQSINCSTNLKSV